MIYFDIIGYIAIIFSLLGFLSENKNRMLIYGIIGTLLFGISIYGYGGYNGLFVSLISIIGKIFGLTLSEKNKIYILYLSPFISIIVFLLLKEGLQGILPAISLFFIIGADMQKKIINMKKWYYGSNILWLGYGILCGSISAILFDILGFIVLTYSILKIKENKRIYD